MKEDLVVNGPIETDTFEFETVGATVAPSRSERSVGDLAVGGTETLRLAAPSVMNRAGDDVSGLAAPSLGVAERRSSLAKQGGQDLSLSVDAKWLASLKVDDFPVVIDPSYVVGADNWASYGIVPGYYCGTSCGHRVGNSMAGGDMYWRSVLHIPYEANITYGKKIVSATLNVWRNSGTSNANPLYACWASAWSFAGACSSGFSGSTTITDSSTIDLTNLYRHWVDNGISGGSLGLVGNDQSGLYTFKELGANLTIVWNTPPPQPADNTTTTPADQTVFATLTPTLSMNALTDLDGDGLIYGYSIATGSDGLSGAVTSSGPVLASGGTVPWTVPTGALRDGQTYYWRAYAWDTKNLTMSTWTRRFKVDMRLGAGGPTPMDSTGPVGVNLATGNATFSIGTPSLPTVGGNAGVNLVYNSLQAPSTGLRGSYFNDNNTNKTFDDALMFSRDDPQVNFDWYLGAPATPIGIDNFLVRWEGYINPGAGTFNLGVISDDGIRVYLDGSTTPVIDRWFDQGVSSTPNWSGNVVFTGGAKKIRIEYYEGGFTSAVQLHIKASTSSTGTIVPASMLSTDSRSVPSGWTMATADAAYVSATVGDQSVVLRASDGSSYEYRKGTGATPGWVPPTGIDDVMVTNFDGTIAVYADSGQNYVFQSDGQLKHMTSSRDDLHPAALEYTWQPLVSGGDPLRLKEIWDPVSNRNLTLTYASSATTCPTAGGSVAPPTGMLCKVLFWDGTSTDVLYDSSGRIVRIVNPGGATSSFVYDTSSRVTAIYDPLANDAMTAGVRFDTPTTLLATVIGYTGPKVTSVTAPEPETGKARPQKTYTYGAGTTSVTTAGVSGSASVSFDSNLRTTGTTDATGKTTSKTWDSFDRPTSVTDAAGIKSTTIYDSHGWATDTYGPAPAGMFSGLTGSGIAHASTAYDQGINGLAAAWYSNSNLSGTPAKHTTGVGTTGGEVWTGWSTPPHGLPAGNFGVRLTGDIVFPGTGTYTLNTVAKSKARLYIDDNLITDAWTDPGSTAQSSANGTFNNPVANVPHRIRIEMADTSGDSSIGLMWTPPAGSSVIVPGTNLKPRYGLPTTTTDASGRVTTASYSASNGIGPEFGLQTSGTRDPGGLALTTSVTYETPSTATFLRRLGRQLPAGSTTAVAYEYYGNSQSITNPCPGGSSANQAGRLKMSKDADPDGSGPKARIEHETVYDAAGRVVASRTGTAGSSDWICTTYDSRGRPATVTYPANAGYVSRTVTYNYAVDGNPLKTSVSDSAGMITTTVDLLGRVVKYKDVHNVETTRVWDQAGRLTSAAIGATPAITYTYDAAGRLETLSRGGQLLADPGYDAYGRMDSVSYPSGTGNAGNGTTGTFTFSPEGRPASVTWREPNTNLITSDEIKARDASGRITDQAVDGVDPFSGANYVYDQAGRLTSAQIAGHAYTYNYAATNPTSCTGVDSLATTGKNTNRTSMVDNSTTVGYCYDNADRITKSTDTVSPLGSPVYDSQGNATTIFGETHAYDTANRHLKTVDGSTTVEYVRDATDRIVQRKVGTTVVAKYASSGGGDTPSLTLDGSGAVVESTLVLPGGVMLTTRSGGNVWSYPNTHGDHVAVATQAGAKVGSTTAYDPYGNLTSGSVPDNSDGSFDYGWLGSPQRPLEQQSGLEPMIEMGARQYSARLGRFIEQDPVEGGSANDYDYVSGDPINGRDIPGTCGECYAFAAFYQLFRFLAEVGLSPKPDFRGRIAEIRTVPVSWQAAMRAMGPAATSRRQVPLAVVPHVLKPAGPQVDPQYLPELPPVRPSSGGWDIPWMSILEFTANVVVAAAACTAFAPVGYGVGVVAAPVIGPFGPGIGGTAACGVAAAASWGNAWPG